MSIDIPNESNELFSFKGLISPAPKAWNKYSPSIVFFPFGTDSIIALPTDLLNRSAFSVCPLSIAGFKSAIIRQYGLDCFERVSTKLM